MLCNDCNHIKTTIVDEQIRDMFELEPETKLYRKDVEKMQLSAYKMQMMLPLSGESRLPLNAEFDLPSSF